MPLTIAEVKNAKPDDSRDRKLADGGGLYLFVSKRGGRSWRLKYRYAGKEKVMTFGLFPEVGLAEARAKRDAAKRVLRDNKDPAIEAERERQAALAASGSTFETIALEWHEDEKARWSPGQAALVLRALQRDVFPQFGKLPVAEITSPTVLKALRRIEARGSIETAKRVRGYVLAVFARAEAEHLIARNPAASIGKALKPTPKGSKQPALVTPPELLELQRVVDASTAGPAVKLASRLLALTGVRIGVLRTACWREFAGIDWSDPDAPAPEAVWHIPAERMKLDQEEKGDEAFDHDVPLSPAAVDVLRALRILTGRTARRAEAGRVDLVFPGQKSTDIAMSDSALSTLYKRMDGGRFRSRHVPHGWRAAFSTIMNEWVIENGREGDRLILDLMLAHRPKGMSGSEFAYNRARYGKRRRELADVWAGIIAAELRPPLDLLRGQER